MVQRRTTPRRVGVPRAAATAAKASIKAKAKPRAKAKPKAKPVTPRRSQRRAPSSEAEPESEPENAESDAEQQQQQDDEDDDTDREEEEDGDAALFLEALARDAQRKPPVPPRAFELPFSASEIANIEVRVGSLEQQRIAMALMVVVVMVDRRASWCTGRRTTGRSPSA